MKKMHQVAITQVKNIFKYLPTKKEYQVRGKNYKSIEVNIFYSSTKNGP